MFIISRIKQLYIPFVIFYLILYIYWVIVERPMRYIKVPEIDAFLGLFWGTNNSYWIYPGGVMWFVLALFSMELLVFPILKWGKTWYLKLTIIGFFSIVGLLLSKYYLFILPLSLPNALLALPFFIVGYVMRPFIINKSYYNSKLKLFCLLIPFLAFTIVFYPWLCELGKLTDVSYLVHPHFYWFYTIPLIEIGLWFIIAMIIEKNQFLEWLGRNTLPILAFHPPISRALIYIAYLLWGYNRYDIREDVFRSICLTLAVIICCLPFIYLWNKLYPRIISFVFNQK